MEVKSMARVKYSYNVEGISLSGLSQSNVVTTEIRKKSIVAKKLASAEFFKPNDIITYTIILNNTGNVTVSNVYLVDEIKNQGFIVDSFSSFTLEDNEKFFNFDVVEDQLHINVETLEPQEILIITYKTIIGSNIDKVRSRLKIECDDIQDIKEQSIEINQGFAQIECVKRVSDEYTYLNTDLSYELFLINKGNVGAYNVEVYDELPVTYELNLENGVMVNGEAINYSYIDNILNFVLPVVPANDEVIVKINGKITK